MSGLTRRDVLALPLGLGAAFYLPEAITNSEPTQRLRGFIVSDAHFGSVNVSQPTPDEQLAVMRQIFSRFPRLDVCIDTGDAHHSEVPGKNGKARARQDWLTRIAGQSLPPFFYVPGNHELSVATADPEAVACDMGSLSLRPYHSFTIKNIHFVCVPQLVKTILVSKETIEWLKLDLAVHRDKTVIVLAHNAITGTTYSGGVTAYREIINSPEVLSVLDAHPNVIAWMHGHNHQYEVVEKGGRVYVSNGRIGGFNPPASWGAFGQGHLGGIYFEVAKDELLIRSYSATADRFLDELGMPDLSLRKTAATSFSAEVPPSVCAGRGAARSGMNDRIHNHAVSAGGAATVFAFQTAAEPINDNWDLALETRLMRRKLQNKPIGFRVDIKDGWRRWDKGIEILPRSDGRPVLVTVPQGTKEVSEPGRGSYLPCNAGERYQLQLDVDAGDGGQIVETAFGVRTSEFKTLGRWETGNATLKPGATTHHFHFEVPSLQALGVGVGATLQLLVFVQLSKLSSGLKIDNIRITPAGDKVEASATELTVGNQSFTLADDATLQSFTLKPPSAGQINTRLRCQHTQQVAWLVRSEQLHWQVRNAHAHGTADQLVVKLRAEFVPKSEIVISRFGVANTPYVSKLINAASATIEGLMGANKLTLLVHEATNGDAPVVAEVQSRQLPNNAKSLNISPSKPGAFTLTVHPGQLISMTFPTQSDQPSG